MISELMERYCCDDIRLIENYDLALRDEDRMWACHHRLETHDENGNLRDKFVARQELIDKGLYYSRPASELIFMTVKDHMALHKNGKANKGRRHTEETKRKIGQRHKGRKRPEETKRKMREAWERRKANN